MNDTLPITVKELRAIIGMDVIYHGQHAQVIEVLEEGPSLVLQASGTDVIQSNMLGHPTRRSPETLTVRVLSEDGKALHKDFLDLDLA